MSGAGAAVRIARRPRALRSGRGERAEAQERAPGHFQWPGFNSAALPPIVVFPH